jgi:L-alanine-DL-glutamate epimerase-like enolase superfamily enzyme
MRLSWTTRMLTLREPLRISRGAMSERAAVEVTLTHDDRQGCGEVVTSRYYQLDLAAIGAALAELHHIVASCARPADLLADLRVVRDQFADRLAVVAALDSALHDLLAKMDGCAVHEFLGLGPWRPRPTAYTIGITDPFRAARQAAQLTGRGFTVIKVKLGGPDDVEVVQAVRAAAPHATLLLDPNGAWNPTQAVTALTALARYHVAAVEQPVPPGHLAELAWVSARSPIPVLADEDARTATDVPALAGTVHGVNVKLVECGGLDAALEMIRLAHTAGLSVQLGCVSASSLGLAPAVHLASVADWLDLDGHLLLADDPWTGIGGADGTLRLDGTAGLGVRRRT